MESLYPSPRFWPVGHQGSRLGRQSQCRSGQSNYREALAAAKAGDKSGAENALYELSVDLSIESGSTAPLYIINSQIK
jgi:hypothetical protein